jgi:hypothetical protein
VTIVKRTILIGRIGHPPKILSNPADPDGINHVIKAGATTTTTETATTTTITTTETTKRKHTTTETTDQATTETTTITATTTTNTTTADTMTMQTPADGNTTNTKKIEIIQEKEEIPREIIQNPRETQIKTGKKEEAGVMSTENIETEVEVRLDTRITEVTIKGMTHQDMTHTKKEEEVEDHDMTIKNGRKEDRK